MCLRNNFKILDEMEVEKTKKKKGRRNKAKVEEGRGRRNRIYCSSKITLINIPSSIHFLFLMKTWIKVGWIENCGFKLHWFNETLTKPNGTSILFVTAVGIIDSTHYFWCYLTKWFCRFLVLEIQMKWIIHSEKKKKKGK